MVRLLIPETRIFSSISLSHADNTNITINLGEDFFLVFGDHIVTGKGSKENQRKKIVLLGV